MTRKEIEQHRIRINRIREDIANVKIQSDVAEILAFESHLKATGYSVPDSGLDLSRIPESERNARMRGEK